MKFCCTLLLLCLQVFLARGFQTASLAGRKDLMTRFSEAPKPRAPMRTIWFDPEVDDTKGFGLGDRVKVKIDQKLWHVNGYREEGLQIQGAEGTITNIWLRSRKGFKEITVNLPLVVEFEEPVKFKAHFNFDEVDKLS
uniref:Ferredoxin thioredoxin reductase alpha chain domain-containing protein n=1 Tax=Heterosigma akashiwo TaxID=2829 RepID=A0A6V1JJ49_HETAK|mmetsp:Transcript_19772/g.27220  ORF Transcript_19772/g.27220 Transcript_19772/m.27220 type:complete len:138 (-) Transcript_19772:277-690(-)